MQLTYLCADPRMYTRRSAPPIGGAHQAELWPDTHGASSRSHMTVTRPETVSVGSERSILSSIGPPIVPHPRYVPNIACCLPATGQKVIGKY